jgi:hypothetical protein
MDDIVTIEYRGIAGTLVVGSSVVVESCHAGVLRLRVAGSPSVARSSVNQEDAVKPAPAKKGRA